MIAYNASISNYVILFKADGFLIWFMWNIMQMWSSSVIVDVLYWCILLEQLGSSNFGLIWVIERNICRVKILVGLVTEKAVEISSYRTIWVNQTKINGQRVKINQNIKEYQTVGKVNMTKTGVSYFSATSSYWNLILVSPLLYTVRLFKYQGLIQVFFRIKILCKNGDCNILEFNLGKKGNIFEKLYIGLNLKIELQQRINYINDT